jgi:hypothetical protein
MSCHTPLVSGDDMWGQCVHVAVVATVKVMSASVEEYWLAGRFGCYGEGVDQQQNMLCLVAMQMKSFSELDRMTKM